MPGLLEFLGLSLSGPSAPIEMVDMATSTEDKAMLARARKTLAYAKQNSPDEAVRILNRVLLELKDLATRSRGEVIEVLGEAESAVHDYVAEARKTVSNHCAHWAWTGRRSPGPRRSNRPQGTSAPSSCCTSSTTRPRALPAIATW